MKNLEKFKKNFGKNEKNKDYYNQFPNKWGSWEKDSNSNLLINILNNIKLMENL